jgi:hypothetical protein
LNISILPNKSLSRAPHRACAADREGQIFLHPLQKPKNKAVCGSGAFTFPQTAFSLKII